MTQSEDLVDAPMPVDQQATDGWRAWSDEAGSLREEHTLARHSASDDEAVASVLEREDEDYLRGGATTAGDLDALAPKVPVRVRQAIADADPSLEQDLAMWWAADCPLPRLMLLGPVWARARGIPPTKQKPYLTEVLAFLATRPHGATPEEVAERFNVSPTKARDYVNRVRDWLGVNPRTGTPHLPDARKAPAALDRGVGVYQVLDLLVDVDLFRRLRVRGVSRGPAGVEDLRQALRLVQGRPFDQLRLGGWSWLCEGDRLDQHMVCAIVDVAHLVSTDSLQAVTPSRHDWRPRPPRWRRPTKRSPGWISPRWRKPRDITARRRGSCATRCATAPTMGAYPPTCRTGPGRSSPPAIGRTAPDRPAEANRAGVAPARAPGPGLLLARRTTTTQTLMVRPAERGAGSPTVGPWSPRRTRPRLVR